LNKDGAKQTKSNEILEKIAFKFEAKQQKDRRGEKEIERKRKKKIKTNQGGEIIEKR